MPRTDERPDLTDTGLSDRAAVASFCGGAGGSSAGADEVSPSGPRGPIESSSDSRVVDCVPKRRVVRAALPWGDLVAGLGASSSCGSDFDVCSAVCQSNIRVWRQAVLTTRRGVVDFRLGQVAARLAPRGHICDPSARLYILSLTDIPPHGESSSMVVKQCGYSTADYLRLVCVRWRREAGGHPKAAGRCRLRDTEQLQHSRHQIRPPS